MNSPDPDFDRQKLHELSSAVMDGAADEHQRRELTELLRTSATARDEYLALVDLHATLATHITTASSTSVSRTNQTLAPPRRSWIPYVTAAAVAACLLISIILIGPGDSEATTDSFATFAQATEAIWDSAPMGVGERIGAETLQLKEGLIRLEFDSGVEVTLEGPAVFKLVDESKSELKSGLLTATVPPGAEGFTVDTPAAQVIDLGTSFGIDLSNEGFANVSVFDGEVEVSTPMTTERDTTTKHLISEGESVRIGTDHKVEDISFDPKPFENMWPTASGIVSSTEAIHFVPPWPRQIRFVKSDDQIFVGVEGRPVQLQTELNVNISEPGNCAEPGDLSPIAVPTKTTVRSYILHFSPESQLGRRRAKRVSGSITFDRPVLGIIVRHEELLASRQRFGRRSVGEANQRRELSLTGNDMGDRISLSEDRKTVSLDLISLGRSSDLVRVIVAGRSGNPPPRRRNRN
ncbi:MAG: FecR domain-containing protein [Planctomycetota bacterium]